VPFRIALLALVLLALGAVPAAAAERSVPRGWLGVQADGIFDGPDPVAVPEWGKMATAGVESVRLAVFWANVAPTPDALDLRLYDEQVSRAAQAGLRVVPVVQRVPQWAARIPNDAASPPSEGRGTRAYADFLRALVARYGPSGTLWSERPELPRLPIRAWQVWNEPNLRDFWSVQPFARSYVALLRAADRALERADPFSTTVLSGLVNDSPGALRQIYRAGGRGAFDAVALHPYTRRPRDVVRLVERARLVMRRAGDRRLALWVTELSWTSAGRGATGGFGIETSEAGQARRLTEAVTRLARSRRRLGIARVYWYTWLSTETPGSDYTFDFAGLRRLRGGRVVDVPALRAFTRVARRLQGCAKVPGDARRCR